jgi:hypothetical protein
VNLKTSNKELIFGRKNNQNFTNIPYTLFKQKLNPNANYMAYNTLKQVNHTLHKNAAHVEP